MIFINNKVFATCSRKILDNLSKACCRLVGIMVVSFLLASCASLKFINPFKELEVKDLEPRVKFVDQVDVAVEPTELPKINPELVVASYKRLLNRGNSEIRKEALRRLADLTLRLAETKLSSEDETVQSDNSAIQEATFVEAISLYETLLKEYPDYQHQSDVKYQLARAHSLNREPEKSLLLLDQIAVITPVKASSYVESQFRRGESYFVRKKYVTAEKAYTEVILKGQNTNFYDKALYKRGWSLFKQSLYPEAQEDFFVLYEKLLKIKNNTQSISKLNLDLIDDTKRVISLAFYNQDGAVSVQGYFDKHGQKPYEDEIYDSLAKLYIEQERFQDASDTYLGFVERNPLDSASPDFHSKVIEIYKKGGFPSLILPAKESYVVNYGKNSQFWEVHKGTIIERIKPQLKEHLDDISIFYHAKAQTSKKVDDYLIAAKWYREILQTFDSPKTDSKYRFSLAETLFDGGKFLQAAKEYEIVAYNNQASRYSRDAGYRALVSYQSVVHSKSKKLNEKLTPVIVSGLKFVSQFPKDKESANILARIIEQQLSLNDIQSAVNTSQQLLTMGTLPTKGQKDRARIVIANGLFDLKQYSLAEQAITELLSGVILSAKQKANFHQRRAEAIYKQAEAAKDTQNFEQAIALFKKVGKLEPTSSIAINAHFDAATLLLQIDQLQNSANLFESFRKKYPKNILSKQIPEKLAYIYETQQNWNKAAEEYKVLAAKNTNKDQAREAYWHIANLYLKAKDNTKAIAAFKHYVWTYPEPYLLAQEGRSHLVNLYLKTGDINKAIFWRQKIVQFFAKARSKNNTRTRFLAAESKYILTEPLFSAYKKIKLRLPLARSLKKKKAAMNKALKAYEQVANYQVTEFTSASTHKIGMIYQLLSDDLMKSQRPKGLNEEELEEYGYLLEDQALPFEDKAISLFEINAARTKDNIYNKSVKESIQKLVKLKPAQYNKQEKMEAIENVSF